MKNSSQDKKNSTLSNQLRQADNSQTFREGFNVVSLWFTTKGCWIFYQTPYVKQRGSLRPQPLADVWLYPIFIPDASCSSHNSLWLPSNKHAGCWCFLWQSPWISRTRWREIFPDSLGKPQLVPPWFSKDKRSKVNGTSWLVDAVLKQSLCIQNKNIFRRPHWFNKETDT